ncbi:MAG TPA: cytochrome c [Thermoanaerobaculia bacterium]|nr:cytochrome c [Thermoanaerobaculia bacterium]
MRTLARIALVVVCALSSYAQQPQFLQQNWSNDDRQWFYTTPQGSKLIPYAWAMALERANDETLWIRDLDRFYFLPNVVSSVNPDGLPVGVVRDEQHLGLTCAACHTNQVEHAGTTYQIDGGPTSADLYAFLADLGESVRATSRSATSPKFTRFAQRVLGANNSAAGRAKLFAELTKYNNYFTTFIRDSTPNVAWGRSRTDAFGMIFNRVTAIDLKRPENSRKPDAPVSYPFLWDTSWHNKVQWNGSAPNQLVVERLARNVGEVLGVFAQVDLRKPTFLHWYYKSTANRLNLIDIEDRLAHLRAPKWQPAFGAIDQARATRGQAIYNRQCVSCHKIATPGVRQDIVMTPLSAVRTDDTMATVAAHRLAHTGVLQGVRKLLLFGPRMKAREAAGTVTFNAVIGAILSPVTMQATDTPRTAAAINANATNNDQDDPERAELRARLHEGPPSQEEATRAMSTDATATTDAAPDHRTELVTELRAFGARAEREKSDGLDYKARPLDGIWATAPYLHNGSVPTVYDLLLPPERRPRTFHVGNRQLDTRNVGFVTTQAPGTFLFDTSIKGNYNSGHLWGTNLEDEQRMDLIEYLKSL